MKQIWEQHSPLVKKMALGPMSPFLTFLRAGIVAFSKFLRREAFFHRFEMATCEALLIFSDLVPLGDHGFDAEGMFGSEVV